MAAENIQVGVLAGESAQRDAIHIALAPVVAAEELAPGTHVGLNFVRQASTKHLSVGIVDPFLPSPVKKGERFYLWLYPQSVTGMRHHWQHSAFPDSDDAAARLAKEQQIAESRAASEAWLREFCRQADCPRYETLMAAVSGFYMPSPDPEYYDEAYTIDDEYLYFAGIDAHGPIPDEFWDHVENVLGRPVQAKPKHFTCSC